MSSEVRCGIRRCPCNREAPQGDESGRLDVGSGRTPEEGSPANGTTPPRDSRRFFDEETDCGLDRWSTRCSPPAPGLGRMLGRPPWTLAGVSRGHAGITITEPPTRIISGSATHTEIPFAIGAGDAVIAVDDYSDYPAEAGALPHLDAFSPSVEGFAALDPDLVIVTFDPNDLVGGLGALGIPVWVLMPR